MSLLPDQKEHFAREGYLVVENALSTADLQPLIDDYAAFIDQRARQLQQEKKLSQLYADEPFSRRLAHICRENLSIYRDIDLMHFRGRAAFAFLHNDTLLDLVEAIIGPEITCSPIQHARAKLPANLLSSSTAHDTESKRQLEAAIAENVAPWHQDAQVHLEEADPSFILTVWLPLCDATPENGCLQLIPRQHRRDTVYWSEGFGISDENLPAADVVTLPMKKGSVLLMHKLIPHRSTANNSDDIRWSLDLRYQRSGTPTGRSFYPDFVARSRANPAAELRDYDKWSQQWQQALAAITPADRPRRQNRPTRPQPMPGAADS